jgi:hypothetical protein
MEQNSRPDRCVATRMQSSRLLAHSGDDKYQHALAEFKETKFDTIGWRATRLPFLRFESHPTKVASIHVTFIEKSCQQSRKLQLKRAQSSRLPTRQCRLIPAKCNHASRGNGTAFLSPLLPPVMEGGKRRENALVKVALFARLAYGDVGHCRRD